MVSKAAKIRHDAKSAAGQAPDAKSGSDKSTRRAQYQRAAAARIAAAVPLALPHTGRRCHAVRRPYLIATSRPFSAEA